jgi:uncharacterized LabA/DUF88 family protein
MEEIVHNQEKPKKLRCSAYIDGLNAYYGMFKEMPEAKWLNIKAYFEYLFSRDDVVAIKYFTAIIDPETGSAAQSRQQNYLQAIKATGVRVILGVHQKRTRRCKKCNHDYESDEEKKTDVNIAVHMIGDVVLGKTDSIVLVSGDSDLQPAIAWIKNHRADIRVTVYVPTIEDQKSFRRSDFYDGFKIPCSTLPIAPLLKCQLPEEVTDKNGFTYKRPESWA